MKISLNDCPWKVQGWWPWVPIWKQTMPGIMGNPFLPVTDPIPATVPGGVHYDLWKAGVIDDPYFARNSVRCEWVENRWWHYTTVFAVPADFKGKNVAICFKGIDYAAHFFLDGTKLGDHTGQFDGPEFDITHLLGGRDEHMLEVILESVPDEMSEIGYTSRTWTQKSRFAYKWDWSTRLVNIGIWDDVFLIATGAVAIREEHITTTVEADEGLVGLRLLLSGQPEISCRAEISLALGDSPVESVQRTFTTGKDGYLLHETLRVTAPELWYPNGHGEQPLYKLNVAVFAGDELSDEREYLTGIRKLGFRPNQDSPAGALPYTIVVNDISIYGKSVNLAPWDQMYGNVTAEVYERNVRLLYEANINLVRINGCGLIEKEIFYDLCDRYGILVWQDFIQSSSGIENIPSIDPAFLTLLKNTAEHVIREKRNHVSTTIWCGGNELMDESTRTSGELMPVTAAHPNIAMLKKLVSELDPGKLFLPSSASGPNYVLDPDTPGRNHDVHGPHTYRGTEKHYEIYNKSDSLFHGELGVNGMAHPVSLRKFLEPDDLQVTTMAKNLNWRHHGEWWDSLAREQEIFGELENLDRFVKASQFVQAEGLRYALESNRRRKFRNSGSSIWSFNEAFPNVSNCAIVDYYGMPKMAYYWVKQAYAPLHCSLAYEGLSCPPGKRFSATVHVHNSLESRDVTVRWDILDASGEVHRSGGRSVVMAPNSATAVAEIDEKLPEFPADVFFIRLQVQGSEGDRSPVTNLYVFSQKKRAIFSSLFSLTGGELETERTETGFRCKNTGNQVCLFVHGYESTGRASVIIDNNYTSLFPGEEETFKPGVIYAPEGIAVEDLVYEWDFFNVDPSGGEQ